MQITESILDTAIRKATEAGLFSRRGTLREMQANREIMRSILEAVADAADAGMPEERSMEIGPEVKHGVAHPVHGHAQHDERRADRPCR